MAFRQSVISLLTRVAQRPPRQRPSFILPISYMTPRASPPQTQRLHSTAPNTSSTIPPKLYTFEDIQALITAPSPTRVLIDVREPAELQNTGRIPTAQNLPIKSAPEGLFLPADVFEARFGFPKPSADTEVVFYCRSGVRSRSAAGMAEMAGWKNVGEYGGSWIDWEAKGGSIDKVRIVGDMTGT